MYWGALIDGGAIPALKNVMHAHDPTVSPEHPSAHDLAKTAMAYIEGKLCFDHRWLTPLGTVVSAVPSPLPSISITVNQQPAKPDPTKALVEKDAGNELFLAGKYVDSIVRYTKAIEYDPDSYALYSNRAAGEFFAFLFLVLTCRSVHAP